MPQAYSKEELMALGVYELRNLAREVGVKAPTMLTKEEIANAVILVLRGDEKPQRTNFGRPVKASGKFIEAINYLNNQNIPKEELKSPRTILNNYCSFFSNNMIIPTYAEVLFRGYVKLMQGNTALVMAKGYCVDDFVHNIVITKEIFNEYPLKDGDLVECYAASIGEDKPRVATKITAINGFSVAELNKDREDFNRMLSLYPNKKLVLSKSYEEFTNFKAHDKLFPLGFGSRALISFKNASKRSSMVYQYTNAITKNNNVECLLIAVGESPEDKQELVSEVLDAELIFDDIAEENVLELLDVKINHLLRKVEFGYDGVIIISDFAKFKAYLKDALKLYNFKPEEANSIINKKLLKLMNLAKNSGEDGSLTVLAFAEEHSVNLQDDLALSTINAHFVHDAGYINNTMISLNLDKTFINRKEKIFNSSEYLKSEKFLSDVSEEMFSEKFKVFIK